MSPERFFTIINHFLSLFESNENQRAKKLALEEEGREIMDSIIKNYDDLMVKRSCAIDIEASEPFLFDLLPFFGLVFR